MAEVVLDTNVMVGAIDAADALHHRAKVALQGLESAGDAPVFLDFLVGEAISVMARRATERRGSPLDLRKVVDAFHARVDAGEVFPAFGELERRFRDILSEIDTTGGALNFNDAALVVLQRAAVIGEVLTFDGRLAGAPGFRARTA